LAFDSFFYNGNQEHKVISRAQTNENGVTTLVEWNGIFIHTLKTLPFHYTKCIYNILAKKAKTLNISLRKSMSSAELS